MILDKYIIPREEETQNRGYSITSKIQNEIGELFFAKWIKGIKKDSRQSKILFNKLRHFKKAVYSNLPKIIEYEWDKEKNAYCIIFENINAKPLEECGLNISPVFFLKGMEQIIICLKKLLQEHRLTHGDITPANILVDEELNFYLIDFGLSDITATLSQESELEIFAKEFAAPEKWDRSISKGFPFQSDIYSLGKVIEWYFQQKEINEFEAIKKMIDGACEKNPHNRIDYPSILDQITRLTREISFDENKAILIADTSKELLDELNQKEHPPKFDISPSSGDNILLDLATSSFHAHCIWLIKENKLLVRNLASKDENPEKHNRIIKYGKSLGFSLAYKSNILLGEERFNPTNILQKLRREKQANKDYRSAKKKTIEVLSFYKRLLEKEKKVLEKNSLRLRYVGFEKRSSHELSFKIERNEKYSKDTSIFHHIDKATPQSPEEFEFNLSPYADRKQIKSPLKFSGVAYDFNKEKRILKFKDCERIDFDRIPKTGYLFENISKKEEEKNRQLEAIRKVEYKEVQNLELINYLFNPADLKGAYLDKYELDKVYQTDRGSNAFKYSDNQQRAIINALHREPLTVIQGPPGTGKTTVITEIVLQILNKKPNAKILITSQTNNAVDNVLENLLEKEIPIIRLSGIRQPKSILRKHTLERKIEGWKREVKRKAIDNWKSIEEHFKNELKNEGPVISSIVDLLLSNKEWNIKKQQLEKTLNLFNLKELLDSINTKEELIAAVDKVTNIELQQFFNKLQIHQDWVAAISSLNEKSKINQKLIDTIRVIGATTNHIASKKYRKYNFEFDYVIMDESGKATIAESLIPAVLAERLILVGDHRQLRPMLTSNREVEKWLRSQHKEEAIGLENWDDYFNRASLFEEVINVIDDDFKSQLEVCRRSSKDQVTLSSKSFYEPYGDEAILPYERSKDQEHNLDLKVNSSIIFIDIGNSGKSKKDSNGSSYNSESAKIVPDILRGLDQYKMTGEYSIGIITGYSAQVRKISKEVKKSTDYRKLKNIKQRNGKGEENIIISVVDKFQGLEKDIIIFDLVKSNVNSLGFLANPNRVNVALSRQKKLLFIIGNLTWLLSAKAPKGKYDNQSTALQNYLRAIKSDWIVQSTNQIF